VLLNWRCKPLPKFRGGIIGGGPHENVSSASKAFIEKAQDFLSKSSKTVETPLPNRNRIRFYLLTNNGTFAAEEEMSNFENNTSVWLELFEEGNKVISELQKARG
jgi:ribonucleotide monophosphatase NagD (HAD superfamily)